MRQIRYDIWNRFAARAMREHCRNGEGYADVRGSANLCGAIAQHVSFSRAVAANADTIVVTSGAQQAIALLAQVFVDRGRTTVAIEDPGYPPAFEAFAGAGAKMVGVPVDPEGIVVERIPPDAKVVYVTPSHQFPLGVVMSARRRAALLDFASAHVRRMHRIYAARRSLLLATLQRDFAPWLRPIPSQAGLHIAAMTAPRIGAKALVEAGKAVGVGMVDVRSKEHAEPAASCVLFGFGRTDEAEVVTGLAALRRSPTFSRAARWPSPSGAERSTFRSTKPL